MKDKAVYYDELGLECSLEQATHMCIYCYDDDGRFLQRVVSGCNGHAYPPEKHENT